MSSTPISSNQYFYERAAVILIGSALTAVIALVINKAYPEGWLDEHAGALQNWQWLLLGDGGATILIMVAAKYLFVPKTPAMVDPSAADKARIAELEGQLNVAQQAEITAARAMCDAMRSPQMDQPQSNQALEIEEVSQELTQTIESGTQTVLFLKARLQEVEEAVTSQERTIADLRETTKAKETDLEEEKGKNQSLRREIGELQEVLRRANEAHEQEMSGAVDDQNALEDELNELAKEVSCLKRTNEDLLEKLDESLAYGTVVEEFTNQNVELQNENERLEEEMAGLRTALNFNEDQPIVC